MLLDDVAKLRAELAQHLTLKQAGQQAKAFRTRATQLIPLAAGLSNAQRDWQALREAGLALPSAEPKPALKSHAEELLSRFRSDRKTLLIADEKFRFEFTGGVSNATEELEGQACKAWADYIAAQDDFPGEEILSALAAIPSYAFQVQRIREAAKEFRRLSERRPTAADVASVLALVGTALRKKDEALAAMKGDDLPPEVLTFLRKTGQGGAALYDLTDVVRSWLDARGLINAFRIMPSRT